METLLSQASVPMKDNLIQKTKINNEPFLIVIFKSFLHSVGFCLPWLPDGRMDKLHFPHQRAFKAKRPPLGSR